MTLHRQDTSKTDIKKVESKIILSTEPSTGLLPKKRKTAINNRKKRNFIICLHKKIEIIPLSTSPKNKHRSANQHKLHSKQRNLTSRWNEQVIIKLLSKY